MPCTVWSSSRMPRNPTQPSHFGGASKSENGNWGQHILNGVLPWGLKVEQSPSIPLFLSPGTKAGWLLLYNCKGKRLFLGHWEVLSSFPSIFAHNGSLLCQFFSVSHPVTPQPWPPVDTCYEFLNFMKKAVAMVSAPPLLNLAAISHKKCVTEDRQLPQSTLHQGPVFASQV